MKRLTCATGLLSLALAMSAQAVIIGGGVTGGTAQSAGGSFQEITLPFNPPAGNANEVGNNTFQTPNLYAFNEGQNIVLPSALNVDALAGGGSGSLAAGTVIASHYVFFDPGPNQSQTGYVDFDAPILALITNTNRLAASDFLLNNNVTYLNPGARGLESGDSATIDGGLSHRVNLNWVASTPGDFIRVLTAFSQGGTDPCATNPPGVGGCPANGGADVPEPEALGLLALGLAGVVLGRRRRRRA